MSTTECVACHERTSITMRASEASCPICVMCPTCTMRFVHVGIHPKCLVDTDVSFLSSVVGTSRGRLVPPCIHGHVPPCAPAMDTGGITRSERRAAFLAAYKPGVVQWLPTSVTDMDAICPHCEVSVPVNDSASPGVSAHFLHARCAAIHKVLTPVCGSCRADITLVAGQTIDSAFIYHAKTSCTAVCFIDVKRNAVIGKGPLHDSNMLIAEHYATSAVIDCTNDAAVLGPVARRLRQIAERGSAAKILAKPVVNLGSVEQVVEERVVAIHRAINSSARLCPSPTPTLMSQVVNVIISQFNSPEAALYWLREEREL